jgi:hypothetical protein
MELRVIPGCLIRGDAQLARHCSFESQVNNIGDTGVQKLTRTVIPSAQLKPELQNEVRHKVKMDSC